MEDQFHGTHYRLSTKLPPPHLPPTCFSPVIFLLVWPCSHPFSPVFENGHVCRSLPHCFKVLAFYSILWPLTCNLKLSTLSVTRVCNHQLSRLKYLSMKVSLFSGLDTMSLRVYRSQCRKFVEGSYWMLKIPNYECDYGELYNIYIFIICVIWQCHMMV